MKIITAIASTTHIDRHNERMSKQALDGMAVQIRTKYIPMLIDHDFNKQIGILLYGEVVALKDGEFALCVVSGSFETDKDKDKYPVGRSNTVWKKYCHYINNAEKMCNENLSKSKTEVISKPKTDPNIADLLETHLDSTQVLPDGTVYKIKKFIAATGDLRIEVYPMDHYPAHFHIVSKKRNLNARFDLNTLEFISVKRGMIKSDDIKKIQNFFKISPEMLNKLKNEHKKLCQQ